MVPDYGERYLHELMVILKCTQIMEHRHVCVCVFMLACVHVCACMCVHVHTCVCMHVCMSLCVHVCVCVC